ncbi:MAG TPA: flagellar basal body P-ring formation chaperone FlgA [Bryobacteraceae bacterium]|nr:flagellar basal body P-ring formation chaperone FlgA [Bryobacteraceae bacterium]
MSAVPAFSVLPAALELSFAPQPGHTRVFPPAELKARLARAGVEYNNDRTICFGWPMRLLSAAELRTAMEQGLPNGAEVILPDVLPEAPEGKLVFEVAGLARSSKLWRGHVEYGPGLRYSLNIPVEVHAPFTRVVATVPLRAGERITAEDLRIETGTGPMPAPGSVEKLEDVVGSVPKRLIPAGSPVLRNSLGAAKAIARGDAIQVTVVSGTARLQFDGTAQQTGTVGSPLAIRVEATGRVLHARLEENGRATLNLGALVEAR